MRRTEAELTRHRPLAEGVAARRDPAALERAARRHVVRRPAADPAALLRRARARPAGVLAAARRPARADRASRRCGAATRRRWPRSSRTTSSGSPTARCGSTCARSSITGCARAAAVAQRRPRLAPPCAGSAGSPRPAAPSTATGSRAMSATLVHRGPDSEGTHVDGGVGLAARRLAIIDLDRRRPADRERGRHVSSSSRTARSTTTAS